MVGCKPTAVPSGTDSTPLVVLHGIEPRLTASHAAVLPLNYRTIPETIQKFGDTGWTRTTVVYRVGRSFTDSCCRRLNYAFKNGASGWI